MPVSILTQVIAKGLAFADAFLGYFVELTDLGMQSAGECGWNYTVYSAEMTPCGTAFLADLMALLSGLVYLAPQLLEGLFVVKF